MSSEDTSVVSSLRALRAGCLSRLEANEDWRALKVLENAIGELEGSVGMPPMPRSLHSSVQPPQSGLLHNWAKFTEAKQPSQSDAAFHVIYENGPTPINILVPLVRQRGAQVAGNDPQTNLSSSLSRDGRFKSVRINGVAHWSLKGADDANGGETGADTPAADDLTLLEGR